MATSCIGIKLGDVTDRQKTARSLLVWAKRNDFEGDDYYWREKACYPMALGYFLRAACTLARRFPDDTFHAEMVRVLTDRILSRSNLLKDSRFNHWGLPFPWPTMEDTGAILSGDFFWDADNPLFTGPLPAHHGYGVTTAIVGQGLIDAWELVGREDLPRVIEETGRWCVEDCGYRMVDGKVFFNYSPAMNHQIYNGSALVAAFLARAGRLLGREEWVELAKSAIGLIAGIQDGEGGWVYARERQEIEYHYGYNLESLAIAHQVTGDEASRAALVLGADYYWERLIDADGRCYDNIEKASETRLWAYGWAVSAFDHVYGVTGSERFLDHAETVAEYMMTHLWDEQRGVFRYKTGEDAYYMRDEAHAAYGLARLAVR